MRQLNKKDAKNYLKMLHQLDVETKMMLYEVGERSQSIEKVSERLSSCDIWTYGLIKDDEIVGFISLERKNIHRIRHCGYIVIGILQSAVNRGYGGKLFERIIACAKENEIVRLELTVMKTNTPAIHLYKKIGFQVEGERKKSMYVDGVYVDEWTMYLLISENE